MKSTERLDTLEPSLDYPLEDLPSVSMASEKVKSFFKMLWKKFVQEMIRTPLIDHIAGIVSTVMCVVSFFEPEPLNSWLDVTGALIWIFCVLWSYPRETDSTRLKIYMISVIFAGACIGWDVLKFAHLS